MTSQILGSASPQTTQVISLGSPPADGGNEQSANSAQALLPLLEAGGQGLPTMIPSASSEENHGANAASLNLRQFALVEFGEYETNLYHQNEAKLAELRDDIACKESIKFWVDAALIVAGIAASIIFTLFGFVPAIPLIAVGIGLWLGDKKLECLIAETKEEYLTLGTAHGHLCERSRDLAELNANGLRYVRAANNLPAIDLSLLYKAADIRAERADETPADEENPSPERNRLEALDLPANSCTFARMMLDCYTIYQTPQDEAGQAHLLREQEKLNQIYQHTFSIQAEPEEIVPAEQGS